MRTDGRIDVKKLIDAFRNFAKLFSKCRNNSDVVDVKGELVLGINLAGRNFKFG